MKAPTEGTTATIANLVRNGQALEPAARFAGVDPATLSDWMRRGEAGSPVFTPFVREVTRAQAEAQLRDANLVSQAAQDDWRAAAWRIEQRQQEGELERLRKLALG